MESLLARQAVVVHGQAHLEGRIHQNAVVTREHLGIHAAHGGTYDEVGLMALAQLLQQVYRLGGMHWQVFGHDVRLGQQLPEHGYRARLARRHKAVDVHKGLALH